MAHAVELAVKALREDGRADTAKEGARAALDCAVDRDEEFESLMR